MVKQTKRKGFNFFRSYFDVYNELVDSDKLAFIDALLNKQFLDVEPDNLSGMAKFAYISQAHSISEQVKGWEAKTQTVLNPNKGVKNTPTEGGVNTPTEQLQGKLQGEVEEKYNNKPPKPSNNGRYTFDESKETPSNEEIKNIGVKYTEVNLLEDWTKCRKHFLSQPTGIKKLTHYEQTYFRNAMRVYDVEEIKEAMKCHFMQENKNIKSMYLRPSHFLEHIDKYHTAAVAKEYQLYGSNKVKTAL